MTEKLPKRIKVNGAEWVRTTPESWKPVYSCDFLDGGSMIVQCFEESLTVNYKHSNHAIEHVLIDEDGVALRTMRTPDGKKVYNNTPGIESKKAELEALPQPLKRYVYSAFDKEGKLKEMSVDYGLLAKEIDFEIGLGGSS